MRTNIEIDDDLMRETMAEFGAATKREAVDAAMRVGLRVRRQARMRELRGMGWEGDLEAMRLDKPRPAVE